MDSASLEFGGTLPESAFNAIIGLIADPPHECVEYGIYRDHHSYPATPENGTSKEDSQEWWRGELLKVVAARRPATLCFVEDHGEDARYDASYFDDVVRVLAQHNLAYRITVPMYFDTYDKWRMMGGDVTLAGPDLPAQGSGSIDADGNACIEVDADIAMEPRRLAQAAMRAWFLVNHPLPAFVVSDDGTPG